MPRLNSWSKQVCRSSLLSGRNVRCLCSMLPPGQSRYADGTDRQTAGRLIVTLRFPLDAASVIKPVCCKLRCSTCGFVSNVCAACHVDKRWVTIIPVWIRIECFTTRSRLIDPPHYWSTAKSYTESGNRDRRTCYYSTAVPEYSSTRIRGSLSAQS